MKLLEWQIPTPLAYLHPMILKLFKVLTNLIFNNYVVKNYVRIGHGPSIGDLRIEIMDPSQKHG